MNVVIVSLNYNGQSNKCQKSRMAAASMRQNVKILEQNAHLPVTEDGGYQSHWGPKISHYTTRSIDTSGGYYCLVNIQAKK